MGMVGGGRGAFIGGVHRRAAALDGEIELVAGAFSSDPKKSALSGKDFYLKPSRVYASYQEMAEKEKALPENERIDFVTIVVQNYLHFGVAKTFLEAGFNVICDKPVTLDLEQARELRKIINKSKKVFALTHNYTGYPMVKLARQMIRKGELGELIKVVCEYPQGYAITALTGEDKAIANWRANPKIAGISNCMGDIGTHAENLVHYVTGLEIDRLSPIYPSISQAGLWMTTETFWCASRAEPEGSFMPRRFPMATRTILTSGSTGPRNPWNGIRKSPTI